MVYLAIYEIFNFCKNYLLISPLVCKLFIKYILRYIILFWGYKLYTKIILCYLFRYLENNSYRPLIYTIYIFILYQKLFQIVITV